MGAGRAAPALVGLTLAAGLAAGAAAGLQAAALPPSTLALLAAAVVAAELFEVSPPARSLDPPSGNFSFSSGIHMGAALLVGPWAAALLAGIGVLFADTVRGSAWRKIGFNASVFALATLAGGLAFEALGGTAGSVSLPRDLLPILALLTSYATVNVGLVSLVISLHSGLSPRAVLSSAVRPATSLAEGAIGTCLALLAERNPWDALALVPLLVVAYQALARLAMLHGETARALEALANVVDERDPSTFRHSQRVGDYVRQLAEGLGLSSPHVSRLAWAGRLHDLGKIAVDTSILVKPGALDPEEWETVRRHPRLSARLLRHFTLVAEEARAVEYHHERLDGRGYYGVGADDLPLSAHLLTVADTFDAMTSHRAYRPALSTEEALAEIERQAGSQFHPLVARAFVAIRRGHRLERALSAAERRSLRRALRRSSGRLRPEALRLRLRGGLTVAGGVAGLLLVGLGQEVPGLVLLGAASTAALALRADTWRGGRLGRRLRAALEEGTDLGTSIERVASSLPRRPGLRWAGIVRWDERSLEGALLGEWGWRAARPTQTALTSWLVRDAELPHDLLVCSGTEVGREGTYVALPLRSPGEEGTSGFLVLAFGGRVPSRVEIALRGCAGVPVPRLARARPAARSGSGRVLTAVQGGT